MGDTFDDIADLVIPFEIVEFGGKRYQVRGLGLAQIMYIVRHHLPVLAPIYDTAVSGELFGDPTAIAMEMGEGFTPVASAIIACAMGNLSAADKVATLPFSVQIDALDKIMRLTLVAEGGLEKVMEIVVRAMQGAVSLTRPKA